MEKIRILFQGDSITSWGRKPEEYFDLGEGYVKLVSEQIASEFPQQKFEFVNRGVATNQTAHLLARAERDMVEIQPDILSLMIGINDVWAYAEKGETLSDVIFEKNYRAILETVKKKTRARILLMEPFLYPMEDKRFMREDLNHKIDIVRRLAGEYADALAPLDGIMQSAVLGRDISLFTKDGVHPVNRGIKTLAEVCFTYLKPLI